MSRLDTIAIRQRRSFSRDLLFAAIVAIAAAVSVSSIATAVHVAMS